MVWSGPGDAFLLSWSYRSTFDAGREPGDGKSGPGPQKTVFGAQGTLRTQRNRRMKLPGRGLRMGSSGDA